MTYYKKLLEHETLTVQWDNRDLATLPLERDFDLIWLPRSLLYLNDEAVVVLIRKLWNLLSPKGTLLLVAVQPSDAQVLLEWCTGWTLYGRTVEIMKALFLQAGVDDSAIRFDGVGWWLEHH